MLLEEEEEEGGGGSSVYALMVAKGMKDRWDRIVACHLAKGRCMLALKMREGTGG